MTLNTQTQTDLIENEVEILKEQYMDAVKDYKATIEE